MDNTQANNNPQTVSTGGGSGWLWLIGVLSVFGLAGYIFWDNIKPALGMSSPTGDSKNNPTPPPGSTSTSGTGIMDNVNTGGIKITPLEFHSKYVSDDTLKKRNTGNYNKFSAPSGAAETDFKNKVIEIIYGNQPTFYSDCDYSKNPVSLSVNPDSGMAFYTLAALVGKGIKNDDISSVTVPDGYTVILYPGDNFQLPPLVLTQNARCLKDNGYNDVVSSIMISVDKKSFDKKIAQVLGFAVGLDLLPSRSNLEAFKDEIKQYLNSGNAVTNLDVSVGAFFKQ